MERGIFRESERGEPADVSPGFLALIRNAPSDASAMPSYLAQHIRMPKGGKSSRPEYMKIPTRKEGQEISLYFELGFGFNSRQIIQTIHKNRLLTHLPPSAYTVSLDVQLHSVEPFIDKELSHKKIGDVGIRLESKSPDTSDSGWLKTNYTTEYVQGRNGHRSTYRTIRILAGGNYLNRLQEITAPIKPTHALIRTTHATNDEIQKDTKAVGMVSALGLVDVTRDFSNAFIPPFVWYRLPIYSVGKFKRHYDLSQTENDEKNVVVGFEKWHLFSFGSRSNKRRLADMQTLAQSACELIQPSEIEIAVQYDSLDPTEYGTIVPLDATINRLSVDPRSHRRGSIYCGPGGLDNRSTLKISIDRHNSTLYPIQSLAAQQAGIQFV